jgi:hypothetical protein
MWDYVIPSFDWIKSMIPQVRKTYYFVDDHHINFQLSELLIGEEGDVCRDVLLLTELNVYLSLSDHHLTDIFPYICQLICSS